MTTSLVYTPIEDIPGIRQRLRDGFATGKTKSIAFRKEQILSLAYMIKDNAERFAAALTADLGRHDLEANFCDVNTTLTEVMDVYNKFEKWAKTEIPEWTLSWSLMRPAIRKEPKGTVLIISPFNFPMVLLLNPCVAAIAAGNTVLLKPSELASATAAIITELVPKYLDPDVVQVVNGAVPETTKILELQWDHIMYTGSGRVGKIVAAAAAKHLTPTTLELGGKSPVVIDPKSDLTLAARRILWGKTTNAGQICLAPDYVLCPKEAEDKLVKELNNVYNTFYPSGDPKATDMSRIISVSHTERLKRLLDNTKGEVVLGGEIDVSERYVAPTVVRNVSADDSLMSEEIFGPLLPIIPTKNVDEAVSFINKRDHPLAIYVFSQDKQFKDKVFDNTQSGAAVANEVVLHSVATGLPFGGVGPSGSGMMHGKFAFDAFTHFRATMDSRGWLDKILYGRFPPYSAAKLRALSALAPSSLPPRPVRLGGKPSSSRWRLWLTVSLVAALSTILAQRANLLPLVSFS